MEGDGDQENDEVAARSDRERHADEDAVEEDADLEHEDLQHALLPLLLRGQDDLDLALGRRQRDVGHGQVAPEGIEVGRAVGFGDGGEPSALPLRDEVPRGAETHLEHRHDEDARERNGARHGGVVLCPELGQAWVAEREEGSGEEVHKGGREEDAGAEVPDGEEEAADREAGHEEGQRARPAGHAEDDEERGDVQAEVVVCRLDLARARIALVEATVHGGVGDGECRSAGGCNVLAFSDLSPWDLNKAEFKVTLTFHADYYKHPQVRFRITKVLTLTCLHDRTGPQALATARP